MAEVIDIQTADGFREITGVDISAYFSSFAIFVDLGYPKVVEYYSGQSNRPDRNSFFLLDFITDRTRIISEKINFYKDSLTSYRYWVLIEKFEEIKLKIDTIRNISRYLRTAILPNSYNKDSLITYTLKQGETLQSVSRNVLSDSNSLNDWANIALQNNLIEEDYTPAGDVALQVSYSNNSSVSVQSVIDNLNRSNIYGKDFSRFLEFVSEPDTDDLKVLSPKDTIIQAADVLGNLRKGNNPAFPEDGIDKSFAVGRNIASIAYPSILRQLQSTFQKDDTISSITITEIIQEGDFVIFNYEILTILEELLPKFSIKI